MIATRDARRLAPLLLVGLASCFGGPLRDLDDLCGIFRARRSWYQASKSSSRRWGVPIPVMMAVIHEESRFRSHARPRRRRILWVIPGPRSSSAYGYAQALEGTWNEYRSSTGNDGAARDDFDDAVDFVGWYGAVGERRSGVPKDDAFHFYLAYHEGHSGYRRNTHQKKPWLVRKAREVAGRSVRYAGQLASCRDRLEQDGSWLWPF